MTETEVKHCFLVDDDPDLRRVLRHSLSRAGFNVLECSSLNEVKEALDHTCPHLIVLDVGLLHSDGGHVLNLLAERRCNGWVQLISGRSEQELETLELSGEDLGIRMLPPMTKPFQAGAVRNMAEMVFSRIEGVTS
ncbi:response regulator [Hoeflea sp. AS60]|uniref:response regulator transcription factor n=1 Tax=Hoeflea sp. AS60 TaxID=3135780 RepID=UPI00316F7337